MTIGRLVDEWRVQQWRKIRNEGGDFGESKRLKEVRHGRYLLSDLEEGVISWIDCSHDTRLQETHSAIQAKHFSYGENQGMTVMIQMSSQPVRQLTPSLNRTHP